MRKKARFSSLPTATGTIARAAYARALEARLEVEPLLKSSNLTPQQIKNSQVRMPVKNQIQFLSLVAKELPDPFLGIHLAENVELREMGFVYYVIASSETLRDALMRLARYSGLTNEGVRITCHEGKDITVKFEYVGVSRLSDHQQIECFVVILIRLCRLVPISKSFEEDHEAGELDEAEEVLAVVLPADEDAALPLDPGEEAFDEPTTHVTA
jgi:Arabinose-binding domain of AraC transcription regulator, N-term